MSHGIPKKKGMTVAELRAELFNIRNQDAEVFIRVGVTRGAKAQLVSVIGADVVIEGEPT